MAVPPELQQLDEQLDAVERDAQQLVAGLTEEAGDWRARPDSWSVAECLDHLATANRVYLAAMRPAAQRASELGRQRRRPALPGIVGRLFVRALEPPVTPRFRMKSPRKIRPRSSPPLEESFAGFMSSHSDVRAFLRSNADLDLAGVRFRNPFLPGLGFSLATGLHVLAAHERRHLWQAWRARRSAEIALRT